MIHLIFCQHFKSDKINNIDVFNDRIARHEKTTSFYEKLSHRFRIFKKYQSITSSERVMKFIKINIFLLQKLTYYKVIYSIEIGFLKKIIKLRADINDVLTDFDRAFLRNRKLKQMQNSFC